MRNYSSTYHCNFSGFEFHLPSYLEEKSNIHKDVFKMLFACFSLCLVLTEAETVAIPSSLAE
jgi:hypothetical protein